jgi:hypothetical protein
LKDLYKIKIFSPIQTNFPGTLKNEIMGPWPGCSRLSLSWQHICQILQQGKQSESKRVVFRVITDKDGQFTNIYYL